MPARTNSGKTLIKTLQADYPQFRFCLDRPRFSYQNGTIFVGPADEYASLQLLHELGHALCGHTDFKTHLGRLKIEREAWDTARPLAKKYGVKWDDGYVEDSLDTYRDWLHAKSKCKKCGLTRYQTPDKKYHCPRCEAFCQVPTNQ